MHRFTKFCKHASFSTFVAFKKGISHPHNYMQMKHIFFILIVCTSNISIWAQPSVLKRGEILVGERENNTQIYTFFLHEISVSITEIEVNGKKSWGLVSTDKTTRILEPKFDFEAIRVFPKTVAFLNRGETYWSFLAIEKKSNKLRPLRPRRSSYIRIFFIHNPILDKRFKSAYGVIASDGSYALNDGLPQLGMRYRPAKDGLLPAFEFLNEGGNVTGRLNNVRYVPQEQGNGLITEISDPNGIDVFAVTDYEGRLLGPLLPNLVRFELPRNIKKTEVVAVQINQDEKKEAPLYLPMTKELSFFKGDENIVGFIFPKSKFYIVPNEDVKNRTPIWFVQYKTETGFAYGWATLGVDYISPPLWKSIKIAEYDWVTRDWNTLYGNALKSRPTELGGKELVLAQTLEGKWESYEFYCFDPKHNFDRAERAKMDVFPLTPLVQNATSESALLNSLETFYRNRQITNQQAVAAWQEKIAQEIAAFQAQLAQERAVNIAAFNRAVALDDLYRYGSKLGGDYYLKYILAFAKQNPKSISAERMAGFANQAQDPNLRLQLLEQRQKNIDLINAEVAREAERRRLDIQRNQEWERQRELDRQAWVRQAQQYPVYITPVNTGASQGARDTYLQQMRQYTYGQQDWKPQKPSGW